MADVLRDIFEKLSISKLPPNSNLEIEARFLIDGRKSYSVPVKTYTSAQTIEIAKKLIGKYGKTASGIEQTINFISDNKTKQLFFVRGVQQKDQQKYYQKTQLINDVFLTHNDLPSYKLGINEEAIIPEFPVNTVTIARIRLRYYINLKDWRLDITLVKNIEDFNNVAVLKEYKNKMLYPIEPDNFLEKAPWDFADTVEFELEYIGKQSNISLDMLKFCDSVFDGVIESDTNAVNPDNPANAANPADPANTANQANYQAIIYKIAQYLVSKDAERYRKDEGLRSLSNAVIELDKNLYFKNVHEHITDYYITDKLDGERTLILIDDKSYAVSKSITPLDIKGSTTILDTEFYDNHYYIFDVMYWNGKSLMKEPFEERLKYFDDAKALSNLFRTKPFIRLTDNYIKQIINFKKEPKPYEIDGIILTPYDGLYNTMRVYKYKPVDKLTVDFLIRKCPDKLLGIKPYVPVEDKTLYLLFCGISKRAYLNLGMRTIRHYEDLFMGIDTYRLPNYFPIQFQPSNNTFAYLFWSSNPKLDNEVGEFIYKNASWHLEKIRADRKPDVLRGNYFGNNYKVVEQTWMAYDDPLVIEDIPPAASIAKSADSKTGDNSYFQVHDNPLQKASRNFNSFVKSEIFNEFRGTDWVMDLASGKGQDLFRYATYEMKHLVFLEIDKSALSELIARKHAYANRESRHHISILAHQLDLNEPYKTNIEKLESITLPNHGMDLIVCNFAFHYLIANNKALINIVRFINHYLKPGGRFIFTAFDGASVIKLLNDNSGEWTVRVGDQIQYSIKKQYKTNHLEPIGQSIEILLPFSVGYYKEYLVNIDYIAIEFGKHGFVLELNKSFGEFYDKYKTVSRQAAESMTKEDITYSSLYHYYCLYKKK